jgi:hypothetical protein
MRILLVLSALLALLAAGLGCGSRCSEACEKMEECNLLGILTVESCKDLCEDPPSGATICENRADCIADSTCDEIAKGACANESCN